MAALSLVPPVIFKQALECLGWIVVDEGKFNWTVAKGGIPLTIPKQGKMVSRALLDGCLSDGILTPGDYFDAVKSTGYQF